MFQDDEAADCHEAFHCYYCTRMSSGNTHWDCMPCWQQNWVDNGEANSHDGLVLRDMKQEPVCIHGTSLGCCWCQQDS